MADILGPGYPEFNPVQPAGTFSNGAADIGGAGGGFDFANFNWAGIGNAVNGLIGTVGGLVLAGQNGGTYNQYAQSANPYTQQPVVLQPQQQPGISATTIVVLVILLLLVLGIGYFVIKSNKN